MTFGQLARKLSSESTFPGVISKKDKKLEYTVSTSVQVPCLGVSSGLFVLCTCTGHAFLCGVKWNVPKKQIPHC